MKIFNILLSILLTALLVLALGVACYYVFIYLVNIYKELDTIVINVIYVALAVGFLTMVLTSIIGRRLETRYKNRLNFSRKSEIYQKFIRTWANLIRNNEKGENVELSELYNELKNTEKDFMLLASAKVMKKYVEVQASEKNFEEYISAFGHLILEMRQDLGNSNVGLNGDNLAALFFEISLTDEQQVNRISGSDQAVSEGV